MNKVVQQVKRKPKRTTKYLKIIMIVMAVMSLLMGIVFATGYMMLCFLFAGMYFIFEANADKEYEYIYEDNILEIVEIRAKRRRKTVQVLDLSKLEVIALPDHEAVARYKKDGGQEQLPKFDYTSYEDDIPYYTVITYADREKVKILMDLNEELLRAIKMRNPSKIMA